MALTTKLIAKLTEPGRYGDGSGLYLQITPTGARSWLLRYERGGRERAMGLGPVKDFTLEEARERARKARQLLKDGIDPIDARTEERASQVAERALAIAANVTFRECAEQYFKFHSRKWNNAKHAAQFLSTMKMYAYPVLGKLAVAKIDKALVLKAIEPIWYTKTETASRVRGRIEAVLDFAKTRGYRTGENPASWDGNLVHALPARSTIAKVEHHAALPFVELPNFIAQLATRDGIAARALEFAILTASRTGEIVGSRWPEIDLDAKLWTIPAERMKAKREHRVPLTGRSLEILKALPREGDFVFPGGRKGVPISNMAMAELLKRMDRLDITVHGFRSTFRDWAAERTGYPNHVVEMALAHVVGNKVEAAYRRGDLFAKRARLMADWAKYCTAKPIVTTASNVTSMRRAMR
ncbi:integrase arm-type DNA-binding domain-containing protein [Bradyrhizobium sp. BEA-2-5]|uniref:tyrosine-type recombinase/integrase n=1 Tax=Bradyrhizobium sp. BEA-2-5 TaxID=3080015 RepID=UPI00293E4AF9|nr:integrase arm-type DNA-binding domain-containing protein [Bradyrhizobium sp. BEA-2-5]WOH82149.1 integrase arm-type DNA-binding domain-containing protein [Bradyrhizobium sp. BEA-2-5]